MPLVMASKLHWWSSRSNEFPMICGSEMPDRNNPGDVPSSIQLLARFQVRAQHCDMDRRSGVSVSHAIGEIRVAN